jgi:hypothetical protein
MKSFIRHFYLSKFRTTHRLHLQAPRLHTLAYLRELCPNRADPALKAEVCAYAAQHLPDHTKLGDLLEYLPRDDELMAKFVKEFGRDA